MHARSTGVVLERHPLESVLVASDFSRNASMAIDRAARLPLTRGARVHVVHVLPGRLPGELRGRAEEEARAGLARAATVLSRIALRAGNRDLKVIPVLTRGQTYVRIIQEARRHAAGVIVLGRHGRRSLRDMLIGSTAERVVRESDVPVLVVNLKPARPYHRPMIALDIGDDPRTAGDIVRFALRLVEPSVARFLLFHAVEMPFERRVRSALYEAELADQRRLWERSGARELRRFLSGLDLPRTSLETILRTGEPRRAILREAESRHVDLLVVGTHARSGVAHALLGSVAAWVIRSASCDVAVQRPRGFRYRAP